MLDDKLHRELSLIVQQVVGEVLANSELVPREWLAEHQLPGYCSLSLSYFRKARISGEGPRFVRVGKRILYRRSWVDSWLEDKKGFS